MTVVASLVLFTVGVWIAIPNAGTDYAVIGWFLVAIGLVTLVTNTYLLRRRGR